MLVPSWFGSVIYRCHANPEPPRAPCGGVQRAAGTLSRPTRAPWAACACTAFSWAGAQVPARTRRTSEASPLSSLQRPDTPAASKTASNAEGAPSTSGAVEVLRNLGTPSTPRAPRAPAYRPGPAAMRHRIAQSVVCPPRTTIPARSCSASSLGRLTAPAAFRRTLVPPALSARSWLNSWRWTKP